MTAPDTTRPMDALRVKALRDSWLLRLELGATGEPRHGWINSAACRGMPVDRVTTKTCEGCPAMVDCLHDAMHAERDISPHYVFGVRAGLTAKRRVQVLSKSRRTVAA